MDEPCGNRPQPKAYSYIRMSTAAQLQGDSLRRQTQLSEQYAKQHGLDLDEDLKLLDIGVSAFDGSNIGKGELGAFLDAVKKGKVAQGSMLLIEWFDRLSRGNLQSSITLMMDLLNSGITIVTLCDRKKFVPGQARLEDIMLSVMILSRAHEKSAQKSQRLKAAWENKRQKVHERKITGRCPGWMHLSRTGKEFELIQERVAIVRRMYDEAVNGIGADAIARRLNQEGVEPFGISKGWQKSTVQKILSSRSVLGEFQPMQKIDGKRTPIGETVKNYYPPIIEEAQFFAAQGARIARRMGGGGRKGDKVSNLFSKVAVCGYCHSRMHYLNKGKRGGQFLVCDSSRRGLGCRVIPWNYLDFETSFLSFVRELDLSSLTNPWEENELRAIRGELLSINGKLADARRRNDLIFELLTESANPDASLRGRLHQTDQEIQDLESRKLLLENDEQEYLARRNETEISSTSIASAVAALQDHSSEDLFKTRAEVSQKLSTLVEHVHVFGGGPLSTGKKIQEKKAIMIRDGFVPEQVGNRFENPKPADYKKHRCFVVMFRDNSTRLVRPNPDNPSLYISQFSSKEGFSLEDYRFEDYRLPS